MSGCGTIATVDGVCGNAVSGEVNTISYVLRVEYPHTRHGEFSLKGRDHKCTVETTSDEGA